MPPRSSVPLGLMAAVLAMATGVAFVTLAALSVASGHGAFSWQIALMLGGYGVLLTVAGWLSARGVGLARGAVISLGLLNLIVAAQYLSSWVGWALLLFSLITVIAGVIDRAQRAQRDRDPG